MGEEKVKFNPKYDYGIEYLVESLSDPNWDDVMMKEAAKIVPGKYMHRVRVIKSPGNPDLNKPPFREIDKIAWKYDRQKPKS